MADRHARQLHQAVKGLDDRDCGGQAYKEAHKRDDQQRTASQAVRMWPAAGARVARRRIGG